MLAFGATFELTDRAKGMQGAVDRATEMLGEIPGSWMPQQFDNPANVDVHVRTTAQEVLTHFRDAPFDALITGESDFESLPETMARLARSPGDVICHRVRYE